MWLSFIVSSFSFFSWSGQKNKKKQLLSNMKGQAFVEHNTRKITKGKMTKPVKKWRKLMASTIESLVLPCCRYGFASPGQEGSSIERWKKSGKDFTGRTDGPSGQTEREREWEKKSVEMENWNIEGQRPLCTFSKRGWGFTSGLEVRRFRLVRHLFRQEEITFGEVGHLFWCFSVCWCLPRIHRLYG